MDESREVVIFVLLLFWCILIIGEFRDIGFKSALSVKVEQQQQKKKLCGLEVWPLYVGELNTSSV